MLFSFCCLLFASPKIPPQTSGLAEKQKAKSKRQTATDFCARHATADSRCAFLAFFFLLFAFCFSQNPTANIRSFTTRLKLAESPENGAESQSHRKHQVFYYIVAFEGNNLYFKRKSQSHRKHQVFYYRSNKLYRTKEGTERSQSHRKHQVFYYMLFYGNNERFALNVSQSHRKHQVFYYVVV